LFFLQIIKIVVGAIKSNKNLYYIFCYIVGAIKIDNHV